jgi:regulator of protease activity HflC (stomatin/prohibitin superfamily)
MNADDFQELYKPLRGSKSAMPVLDAKALYSDRQMVAALERLTYARETFLESRSRLLNQDVEQQVDKKGKEADRQLKKLKRKQDKLLDIVKAFDELLPQLEKLAERERERKQRDAAAAEAELENQQRQQRRDEPAAEAEAGAEAQAARADDLTEAFCRAFAEADGDQCLDLVSSRFSFRQVDSEQQLLAECLYLIQTGKQSYLVCTPPADQMDETITVRDMINDRRIKPFGRSDFLKLGTRHKMVLLTRKPGAEPTDADHAGAFTDSDSADGDSAGPMDQNILDMGAFSQLLTSAQRCGLVPGADQIGHVRDREFQKGHYDLAFQAIESMFSRFTAAASQRTQRLMREDADIASGRVKMSPKDLQAKRTRDRTETQEIERAGRRFQVVLEGLRVLMNSPKHATEAVAAES